MSQVVALFSLERRRVCRLKPAPALSVSLFFFFYSHSLSFDSVPLQKKKKITHKEEKKLAKKLAGGKKKQNLKAGTVMKPDKHNVRHKLTRLCLLRRAKPERLVVLSFCLGFVFVLFFVRANLRDSSLKRSASWFGIL